MAGVADLLVRMGYDGRAASQGAEHTARDFESLAKRGQTAMRFLAASGVAVVGKQLFDAGVEAEAFERRFTTVFGEVAESMRGWLDEQNERFGVSESRLAGMASAIGDLLVPLGVTRQEAAELSQETLILANALSEWTGGQRTVTETSEILTRAMLGEREALIGLGVKISEADVAARLLATGQDRLTGAALTQARALVTLELITERSADAMTAYAAGGSDAARAQKNLAAAIDQWKTEAGKAIIQLAPLVSGLGSLVSIVTAIPGAFAGAATALGLFIGAAKIGIGAIIGAPEALAAGLLVMSTQNEKMSERLLRMVRELGPALQDTFTQMREIELPIRPVFPTVGEIGQSFVGLREGMEVEIRVAAANATLDAARSAEIAAVEDAFGASLAAGFSESIRKHDGDLRMAIEDLIGSAATQAQVNIQMEQMARLGMTGFAQGLTGSTEEIAATLTTILGASQDEQLALALAMGNDFAATIIRGMMAQTDRLQGLANWWATAGQTARDAYVRGFGNPRLPIGGGFMGTVTVPRAHSGGIVAGPPGAEVPIIAQAGETILPRGASGGVSVVVNVAGSVISERELTEQIRRQLVNVGIRNVTTQIG